MMANPHADDEMLFRWPTHRATMLAVIGLLLLVVAPCNTWPAWVGWLMIPVGFVLLVRGFRICVKFDKEHPA